MLSALPPAAFTSIHFQSLYRYPVFLPCQLQRTQENWKGETNKEQRVADNLTADKTSWQFMRSYRCCTSCTALVVAPWVTLATLRRSINVVLLRSLYTCTQNAGRQIVAWRDYVHAALTCSLSKAHVRRNDIGDTTRRISVQRAMK